LQIFMHVLWNISTSYWIRKGYNEKQLLELSKHLWISLVQIIELFTGINIPALIKRLYK
jgi:hypothetical protein